MDSPEKQKIDWEKVDWERILLESFIEQSDEIWFMPDGHYKHICKHCRSEFERGFEFEAHAKTHLSDFTAFKRQLLLALLGRRLEELIKKFHDKFLDYKMMSDNSPINFQRELDLCDEIEKDLQALLGKEEK